MGANILLVDDEKHLVYYLRQALLLEFPKGRIDTAFSGEEALSHLADRSYDLIIADLRMPGFDGLELIKGVRFLDATVPIILMTGYGSESLEEKALQLGVNHYVDKPFDVQDLLQTVHKLLSQDRDHD